MFFKSKICKVKKDKFDKMYQTLLDEYEHEENMNLIRASVSNTFKQIDAIFKSFDDEYKNIDLAFKEMDEVFKQIGQRHK